MKKLLRFTAFLMSFLMMAVVIPDLSTANVFAEDTGSQFEYKKLDDGTLELVKYNGKETAVEVPGSSDGVNVTKIAESAFAGNAFVEKITVHENITAVGDYAFESCGSLKKIYLPESLISIGKGAFSGCNHLRLCDIQDKLTSIGDGAFLYCTALQNIYIPDSLKELGKFAFAGCSSLLGVNMRSCAVTEIKDRTFFDCSALSEIVFPLNLESIDEKAFFKCKKIGSIIIPDSVTKIGKEAFFSDELIQSLNLNCEEIGEGAFEGCGALNSVYFSDKLKKIGANAFKNTKMNKEETQIPSGAEVDPAAFGSAEESAVTGDASSSSSPSSTTASEEFVSDITIEELISKCTAEGYKYIKNDEFDSWTKSYLELNTNNIKANSEYNCYVDMYKQEVTPYFVPMGAALLYYAGCPSAAKTKDAENYVGTGFEEMFNMVDHGLATEISRTKTDDDLLLFSGLSGSQQEIAAGTDTIPTTEQLKARIGCEFTDPIMISTTTDPVVASGFGSTMFVIEASKEAMNSLGAICIDAYTHSNEKEILMNTNARYKILDVGVAKFNTTDADGNKKVINERYVLVKLLGK